MPRFNAAKSWKKLDDDLSGKFNYLCDLLDEGYSSVALINNHEIAIDINPKDGIKIVNDGSSIFSLDPLTGEIVIGKYDGLISDLETDLGTAYNDIAQQLGYTDYDDMVAEAIAGNTIINGGWLRTSLIQANTILFNQLASAAVTSITDTIDLGGRNLLRNTGASVTNANYLMAGYDMGDEWPVVGETYTLSVKFTLGADRTHLSLFTPEGTVLLTTVADADKNGLGVASKAFTMSYAVGYTPADGYTSLVIYQMPSGGSAASTIEWVKLEKGNKATDWTPAPEDKLSEGVSYAGVTVDATNGFVSTATIGGESAKVIQNATDGIALYQDDGLGGWDKRGSLSLINGKLVLTIDVLANNSDVLNFVTFEPYYVWNGQTFAGTQYWTDDADASPASVQHLLLLGDVNKASAESQTIISAVALNSSGTDLGYETNLKIGSMVPTQAGDGNYGYAEFIGNTAGGGGSAMLGAGNSDGSDYFNLNVFHNELNVWDETGELLELTRAGGLKIAGTDVLLKSGGTMTGALTFHTLYSPSTAGVYFDSYGNIWPQSGVTTDAYWNIRDNAGNVKFKAWLGKADAIEMSGLTLTGNLAMGSNDITLSGDITGDTTDTWITARRIGLGVAANSTYTVDAGSSGYIRGGKYYAGSSGGVTDSIKFPADGGGYYTLVFTGGIVTGCGWSSM